MNPYPNSTVNWVFAPPFRFKVSAEFALAQGYQQWLIVNDITMMPKYYHYIH